MDNLKAWARATAIRALKTAAEAAIAAIGTTATMGAVDWRMVGSMAMLASIVSVLTCIAGIPEVEGGASVRKMARGA